MEIAEGETSQPYIHLVVIAFTAIRFWHSVYACFHFLIILDVWTLKRRETPQVPSQQYLRFLLCHRDISLRITAPAVRSLKPRRLLSEFGVTAEFTTCEAYRLRCVLEKLLSVNLPDIQDDTIRYGFSNRNNLPGVLITN